MRLRARYLFVAALTATTSAIAFACGDPSVPTGATVEAGIPDATLASDAWGATKCAACTFEAWRVEHAACLAEPGCARNLDCVEACPASADGDPDPACVKACPIATSSAAESPRLALERCRTTGRATACVSCVATHQRRFRNPLLTENCGDAVYDAGPDATPTQEACTKCGAQKCCGTRAACTGDPQCSALIDCSQTCTTRACLDACQETFDSAVGLFNARLTCAIVRCGDECEAPRDRCALCLYDDCADATMACQSDHDCYLLGQCDGKCTSSVACHDACLAKYPAAVAAYSAQLLCVQQRCPDCF